MTELRLLSRLTCCGLSWIFAAGCEPTAAVSQVPPVRSKVTRTDMTIRSGDAALAGSLLLPATRDRVPCVILTHGSDPGIRERYRHLADFFLDKGIAAFTYDKRGCGKSTGKYVEAPDLHIPAQDLVACAKQVRTHPRIDPQRLGVWGISQGGWVGPLAASKSKHIRFVVMISGPSVSPMQQNLFDKANQLRAQGVAEDVVTEITELRRLVWTYLATGEQQAAAASAWAAATTQPWFKYLKNEAPMGDRNVILRHPRMVQFAEHTSYEPEPVLRKLDVPVLAIFGGADTIVPAKRCESLLKDYFAGDRRKLLTTRIFKDADHAIRVSTPGGGRRFAAGYWKQVVDWVGRQGQRPREG